MSLSAMIGILLSVATLSALVVGDPSLRVTITSATVSQNPNDFFGPVTVKIINTERSSILTIIIPVKKELPPTMQIKFDLGGDAFEFKISVCDALHNPFIGSSFVKAGVPKDKLPKACPVGPGNWTVVWDPPVDKIPSGIPDGPISGIITFLEEGLPPYFQVNLEGVLSHDLPSSGR